MGSRRAWLGWGAPRGWLAGDFEAEGCRHRSIFAYATARNPLCWARREVADVRRDNGRGRRPRRFRHVMRGRYAERKIRSRLLRLGQRTGRAPARWRSIAGGPREHRRGARKARPHRKARVRESPDGVAHASSEGAIPAEKAKSFLEKRNHVSPIPTSRAPQ